MHSRIQGLHHVTATVNDAQEDVDFYTRVLGLRLVKKTVNFDNHHVYHFYYGDEVGHPGTLFTTFPYHGKGVRTGRKGSGQITATAFSVPPNSLAAWKRRLQAHQIPLGGGDSGRFGEATLGFEDPSGLTIELIATSEDHRTPWAGGEVDPSMAIRGLHSVTLTIAIPEPSFDLLTGLLGYTRQATEQQRTRFSGGDGGGGPGHFLDIVEEPGAPAGINGLGTVHHVAMAVGSAEEQLSYRQELLRRGVPVTEVLDRQYFQSIYFREPGGVLYEIATVGPGFLVDEARDALGAGLKLPPWEEPNRSRIEGGLPMLREVAAKSEK